MYTGRCLHSSFLRSSAGCVLLLSVMAGIAQAQAPDLAFKPGNAGEFTFDTGQFSGRFAASDTSEGVISLIDKTSGVDLAKGKGNAKYGLLSCYRLLSSNQRWGGVMWDWPKTAALQPDGSLRVEWLPAEDHPAKLSGIFRWSAPDALDLETIIEPQQNMPKLELFVGSYFPKNVRSLVYLAPGRHGGGKAEIVPADVSPLTVGTYCAFPRDLEAAQLVCDGRWEQGLHPVQWSIGRYLAGPLAIRRDDQSKMSVILMSQPADCTAVYSSYNREPADEVAGHYSTYMSLFGRDVKAGETARARARLVVRKDLADSAAIEAYQQFVK